ncbi:Dephospho-CoA kinase [Syntrophobacter fumaroxidans MPOB]|uniref:Dephospho-CoA kinase n=1 Tax=Syntrophobacter fumaroxidans (strain DSM 10017 / MPOB) TaxID=335543 RepID=A0LEL1_SYNFM|nr:Dephospho-CoA kinase [Syntrophobacter fumaroxidans MPOB]
MRVNAKRIALTGGIASGKSTVARMFADRGALILDADVAAREAVEPGSECWQRLREWLAPAFFDAEGRLDRRRLRDLIIRDPQCLVRLNAILHPFIFARMESQWRREIEARTRRVVIFDIPLLFESHAADRFDIVILVHVPPEIQIGRLMKRDGLTRAEAEKTLEIQLPIDSKIPLSQIVIDNSLDLDHTSRQVLDAWNRIAS